MGQGLKTRCKCKKRGVKIKNGPAEWPYFSLKKHGANMKKEV